MSRRDLAEELFSSSPASLTAETAPNTSLMTREVTLAELADLAELGEEQAKVRVKVTHLSTAIESLRHQQQESDRRLTKIRDALKNAASQVERLSKTDSLQAQQLGALSDQLRNADAQLEAHHNALAFLRNSDGQQQQSINRLKQSRITLTHILLFGILLCAGSAIALDIDKAFNFHERLNKIEYRLYP